VRISILTPVQSKSASGGHGSEHGTYGLDLGPRTAVELITVLGGLMLDPNVGRFTARRFAASVPLTALGQLGIAENAIRMALARQVQRGVLSSRRVGRYVIYEITEAGEHIFSEQGLRVRGRSPFSPSSAVWTLVSFSIPESRRDIRSRLRSHLTDRGFRPLRDGLWVALDVGAAEEATRGLDMEIAENSQLDIFIATPHLSTGLADLVGRVWDIDDLKARHEEFLTRWEHNDPPRNNALPALILLAADWLALLERDPGFNTTAVGEDWPGERSARTAARLFNALQAPAGTALQRLLTETDPTPARHSTS
jgi:DNA-binding transcriptional regulator PaaX